MREIKLAVVNVVDNDQNYMESFVYVDGTLVLLEDNAANTLADCLPTDCLNELSVEDLMPQKLKALEPKV